MGISIHGGVGVKGVDLLLHYSIELIGRGDVVEERLDFFMRHDSGPFPGLTFRVIFV